MEILPHDIYGEILRLLPIKDAARVRRVCKRWKKLIETSDSFPRFLFASTCEKVDPRDVIEDCDKLLVVGTFREFHSKGDELICQNQQTGSLYRLHLKTRASNSLPVAAADPTSPYLYLPSAGPRAQRLKADGSDQIVTEDLRTGREVPQHSLSDGPWYPAPHMRVEATHVAREYKVTDTNRNITHTVLLSHHISAPEKKFVLFGTRLGVEVGDWYKGSTLIEVYDLSKRNKDGTAYRCFRATQVSELERTNCPYARVGSSIYSFHSNNLIKPPETPSGAKNITIWEDFLLRQELSTDGKSFLRVYDLDVSERAKLVKEFPFDRSGGLITFDGKYLCCLQALATLANQSLYSFC